MMSVLESCETYDQALWALVAAVESQWADDVSPPVELRRALGVLEGAREAFAQLDSVIA